MKRGAGFAEGSSGRPERLEFQRFFDEMGLLDLPLLGNKLFFFQPHGNSASRLDMILISGEWVETWCEVTQWELARDVSDHRPMVLRYLNQGWGSRPFRFNNHWLKHI